VPIQPTRTPWNLLLAAVFALVFSAGAWAYAAHWRVARAESELQASLRSAIRTHEFVLGRVGSERLHGIAQQAVATHFRGVGGTSVEAQLLARAVYHVVSGELQSKDPQLAGLPVSIIPEADDDNAQRLALALVEAVGSLGKQPEPPRASGASGDPEVWEQYHGPAMALLELADTLDLRDPMPAIYAMRAWFRLKHPQAGKFQAAIVLDVATAETLDRSETLRGLCKFVRAGIAALQQDHDKAQRLLGEARAAGLEIDAQMEHIALRQ